MPLEHPERVTAPGYMWMSGTSFSAPVVSGAAALILAKNPNWTPDKVKGALMLSARPTAAGMALGVGEVNAKGAFDLRRNPPQPEPRPQRLRRPGRHRRPGLRLGQLGEHGHRERLLEPGELEQRLLGERELGVGFVELGQLGKRLLGAGELVVGLLERCQLGSRFLGRGVLERGELGSRFLGSLGGIRALRALVPKE